MWDDSKSLINNCDIDRVDKVTWTEKMLPPNPNYTKSKSDGNNCNKSSRDGDKLGNKERVSNDFESPKLFLATKATAIVIVNSKGRII